MHNTRGLLAAQAALMALASQSVGQPSATGIEMSEAAGEITLKLEAVNLDIPGIRRKGPTQNRYEPLKCEGTRQQQRYATQQAKIAARKAQTKGPHT